MKECPILFSGPMVRAILAGQKTQTRRVVKFAKLHSDYGQPNPDRAWVDLSYMRPDTGNVPCLKVAYGEGENETVHRHFPTWEPGDRLWVRETFVLELSGTEYAARRPTDRPFRENVDASGERDGTVTIPHYRATDPEPHIVPQEILDTAEQHDDRTRWTPSIFMPRWASRITLEVTGVRVERVQEISREDAKAEGFWQGANGLESWAGRLYGNAQLAFAACWKDINGPGSWDGNPWVWVIEFRRVQP